jgi:hypothetical protein
MSTNEKVVSTAEANGGTTETITPYVETVQERVQELRRWRDGIPRFVIPADAEATRRLVSAGSVPPEFVELTNLAVANHDELVRGKGATPAQVRDLMSYADAFDPLADELEALAHFLRHSTAAARFAAGTEALTTYALAQRLAKRAEHAALVPRVADMRRALGRGRPKSPEAAAKKAVARATKAVAQAVKAAERTGKPARQLPALPAATEPQS